MPTLILRYLSDYQYKLESPFLLLEWSPNRFFLFLQLNNLINFRFRKNGITQLSDSNEYEVHRMQRSQKRKNEKKKMIIFQSSQPG